MQGPGADYYVSPCRHRVALLGVQSWLASLPRQRAQAIMRVLTGATLLYAGIEFKVLQPNLCLGIITTYHLPLLWRAPESFTLLMALVEITAGLLIILGILLRPLFTRSFGRFFLFRQLSSRKLHIAYHVLWRHVIFPLQCGRTLALAGSA